MFCHAGTVHLAINSIAFIGMFRTLERLHVCKGWILALSVIACGFIASFPAQFHVPTVGSSSMVYAMIGMYLAWVGTGKKTGITDSRKLLTFILCVVVSLGISYFKTGSNFTLHLLSLLCGGIAALSIKRFTFLRI